MEWNTKINPAHVSAVYGLKLFFDTLDFTEFVP